MLNEVIIAEVLSREELLCHKAGHHSCSDLTTPVLVSLLSGGFLFSSVIPAEFNPDFSFPFPSHSPPSLLSDSLSLSLSLSDATKFNLQSPCPTSLPQVILVHSCEESSLFCPKSNLQGFFLLCDVCPWWRRG